MRPISHQGLDRCSFVFLKSIAHKLFQLRLQNLKSFQGKARCQQLLVWIFVRKNCRSLHLNLPLSSLLLLPEVWMLSLEQFSILFSFFYRWDPFFRHTFAQDFPWVLLRFPFSRVQQPPYHKTDSLNFHTIRNLSPFFSLSRANYFWLRLFLSMYQFT